MVTASTVDAYSDLYAWLVSALCHPEDELIQSEFYQVMKEISLVLDLDFAAELEILEEHVHPSGVGLAALQVEHSQLFIGPFSLGAPPYESYYREKGIVMGAGTADVKETYRKAGFEIVEDFKDAPDHIVLELNFLSELCLAETRALSEGCQNDVSALRRGMKHFLERHFFSWIYAFRKAVENHAKYSFYPTVVKMLVEAASSHYRYLEREE